MEGVTSCSVSLLTNSMGVEGTASAQDIIAAVEKAGYGASIKASGNTSINSASTSAPDPATNSITNSTYTTVSSTSYTSADEDILKDRETPILKKRLLSSLIFWLILMYFSMGHMLWGWPLPPFFNGNHVAMGLLQLLLTVVIMVINGKFFVSGFKSLWHRSPNMDTLVALGSSTAFIYSTIALFAMTDAQVRGDADAVMAYMNEFYFESAATILTLITLGKMLEARSKGKTTNALKSLMKLAPRTATILRDGQEITVSIEGIGSLTNRLKA